MGAAVLVVAAVVTTTLILVNRSSTAPAVAGGSAGTLVAFGAQPKVGGDVRLSDLFEHSTATTNGAQVIAVTPDAFIISAIGQDTQATNAYEDVVASIDRGSGAVKWKVADKDLDPAGSAGGTFACALTQSAARIICAQQEKTANGDDPRVAMTLINVSDGTFSTAEPKGSVEFAVQTVGEDVLLTRSESTGGNYEIVRIDPATGKDKWVAPVTFNADDFSGGYFQNGYVQVPETTEGSGSRFVTDLLNPDTGKMVHQLDGSLYNVGSDYYGTISTGSNGSAGLSANSGSTSGAASSAPASPGSERVSADDKTIWENPDASLMFGSYGANDPLLATEGSTLVGLRQSDGKEVWKSDRPINGYAAGIFGGRGFIEDSQIIRIIRLTDGTQIGTANGTWVGTGGNVFYTTDGGRLYAWDAGSGSNLWRADYHDLSPLFSSTSDTTIIASAGALFAKDATSIGILVPSS